MVTVVFYELDRLVGLLLVENPFPVLDTLNQNFIDRFDPFTGPNTSRRCLLYTSPSPRDRG